jgi:hypothetical protein
VSSHLLDASAGSALLDPAPPERRIYIPSAEKDRLYMQLLELLRRLKTLRLIQPVRRI